jgi:hypothetical protein
MIPMSAVTATSTAITIKTAIPADRTSERNIDMPQVSQIAARASSASIQGFRAGVSLNGFVHSPRLPLLVLSLIMYIMSSKGYSAAVTLDDEVSADLAEPLDDSRHRFRRDPRGRDVPRADGLQLSAPDANDLPPGRTQEAVLSPVSVFASTDMFETVPARRVVFDRNPQLGDHDVGPHLVVRKKRTANPHRIQ